MDKSIQTYNEAQSEGLREMCDLLADEIQKNFPEATDKVWHGAPVWFIDGNPVVGYWARKDYVQLLFWSGQSFEEPALRPEGTFKAAEARYTTIEQINPTELKRWLEKAKTIQWDYKNIVKRKGFLERLF